MINRSTFTLTETYFGQWIDADLGGSTDDFVGCDAERGLGYCYNGDNNDEGGSGITGYGSVPPAIGVDFFEGPYADNDGIVFGNVIVLKCIKINISCIIFELGIFLFFIYH